MRSINAAGIPASSAVTIHCATSRPSTPPASASSRLSVNNWRTSRVRLAVLLLDVADDGGKLLLRLFDWSVRLEPTNDVDPEKISPPDLQRKRLKRSPHVGAADLGEVKAGGHHADDLVAVRVEREALADDVRVAAE